jgi:hypothetical protein
MIVKHPAEQGLLLKNQLSLKENHLGEIFGDGLTQLL